MASDAVAQQADGHIRFEIPLIRPYHVQGSPVQDAHNGGGVTFAHAAVVFPELDVQGVVQAVLHPQWPRTRPCWASASTGRLEM